MRPESDPDKELTPPSIQNLKALGLWVFLYFHNLLISTQCKIKLTLAFLTVYWSWNLVRGGIPLEVKP